MKKAISAAVIGSVAAASGTAVAAEKTAPKAMKLKPMKLTPLQKRKDVKLRKASNLLRSLDPNLKIKWVKGRKFGTRIIQING